MDLNQKINALKVADTSKKVGEAHKLEAAAPLTKKGPPQYLALRLTQYSLPSGKVVKPVKGVYTPASEAEEALLEYYLEQDQGLVSRL